MNDQLMMELELLETYRKLHSTRNYLYEKQRRIDEIMVKELTRLIHKLRQLNEDQKLLVQHIGHAHMGNSFHSGFFVDLSSNGSHQQRLTVCFGKKLPQSALISPSSLIMHDNWKI